MDTLAAVINSITSPSDSNSGKHEVPPQANTNQNSNSNQSDSPIQTTPLSKTQNSNKQLEESSNPAPQNRSTPVSPSSWSDYISDIKPDSPEELLNALLNDLKDKLPYPDDPIISPKPSKTEADPKSEDNFKKAKQGILPFNSKVWSIAVASCIRFLQILKNYNILKDFIQVDGLVYEWLKNEKSLLDSWLLSCTDPNHNLVTFITRTFKGIQRNPTKFAHLINNIKMRPRQSIDDYYNFFVRSCSSQAPNFIGSRESRFKFHFLNSLSPDHFVKWCSFEYSDILTSDSVTFEQFAEEIISVHKNWQLSGEFDRNSFQKNNYNNNYNNRNNFNNNNFNRRNNNFNYYNQNSNVNSNNQNKKNFYKNKSHYNNNSNNNNNNDNSNNSQNSNSNSQYYKKYNRGNYQNRNKSNSSVAMYSLSINTDSPDSDPTKHPSHCYVSVGDLFSCHGLADSGSEITVISAHFAKKNGFLIVPGLHITFKTWTGFSETYDVVKGLRITLNDRSIVVDAPVLYANCPFDVVLGVHDLFKLDPHYKKFGANSVHQPSGRPTANSQNSH